MTSRYPTEAEVNAVEYQRLPSGASLDQMVSLAEHVAALRQKNRKILAKEFGSAPHYNRDFRQSDLVEGNEEIHLSYMDRNSHQKAVGRLKTIQVGIETWIGLSLSDGSTVGVTSSLYSIRATNKCAFEQFRPILEAQKEADQAAKEAEREKIRRKQQAELKKESELKARQKVLESYCEKMGDLRQKHLLKDYRATDGIKSHEFDQGRVSIFPREHHDSLWSIEIELGHRTDNIIKRDPGTSLIIKPIIQISQYMTLGELKGDFRYFLEKAMIHFSEENAGIFACGSEAVQEPFKTAETTINAVSGDYFQLEFLL
ncbi:hypothetical protein [Endozoicomonas sp. ALC066]|uniref:hypothetical protein n=1 Tax=Endozoicomonas sp. ALC066 TaxID=3403078 RepID=UPI003BB768FA